MKDILHVVRDKMRAAGLGRVRMTLANRLPPLGRHTIRTIFKEIRQRKVTNGLVTNLNQLYHDKILRKSYTLLTRSLLIVD